MVVREINNQSFTFQKDVKPHPKYHIKKVKDKEVWENFLLGCKEKTFLDSWNWGEFQKKQGEKIWRFGIYDNEQLLAVVLVIKVRAKRGTFLFVPHGPILRDIRNRVPFREKELGSLVVKLKEIAKEEKASFIRIAPIWQRSEENIKIFKDLGFRQAPTHIHPEVTWELDIRPAEEQLLMGMRKTTRYLIRQAQKNNDIEVVQSKNIEDLKNFNRIYNDTAQRHHFVPFSLDYLKNEFSSFLADNQISVFSGKYKGEVVCSSIVIFWQDIGFYHQGASLSKYNSNKVPVSYLVQWEAIKEAKKRGCSLYNFWGIVPEDKKNHPWIGLTLFKKGFGGYGKEYVKTQDLPLSFIYWFTFLFEKIRKIKRGL